MNTTSCDVYIVVNKAMQGLFIHGIFAKKREQGILFVEITLDAMCRWHDLCC